MRKLTLLALAAMMLACTQNPDKGLTPVDLQTTITSVQPMTGMVLWLAPSRMSQDLMDQYKDAISLESSPCLPYHVVTGKKDGKIQYDWTYFEDKLNAVAARGHQSVVRIRYEYPGSCAIDASKPGTTAVPQYIKDLPDYHETFNPHPDTDGPTYYADWSNSELLWFTKQFYTDFAARYNNDARIAFMEIGFGHWGEYHIFGTPLRLGVNFPTHTYQAEVLQLVDSVFSLPWAISIDAADTNYTPIVQSPELMDLGFGLFDDSFMHETHEGEYNELCWNAIGANNRWEKGVCGGEVSYYVADNYDQKNFLNPAGMYGHTWEEQAKKYHITFMMAEDAPYGRYGTPARFVEAALASGYRFEVTKCLTSDSLTAVYITNKGVAPFYYDAYLCINNMRSEETLRLLLPHDTLRVTIPCRLNDGSELHIECDHLLPGQKIQFESTTATKTK